MEYFFVILISVLTAYTELLSRYDDPILIIRKFPSIFYLLLNAFIAALVYRFIDSLSINVIINDSNSTEISQIILAGTSSLLLLRSSFGIYKKGDQNIEIGLSGVLKIIFDFCDRKFDQIFTNQRFVDVEPIMYNEKYIIDFEKAKTDLPILCMKMMSNLSNEEQNLLGSEVADLEADVRFKYNKSKIIRLGFIISKYTGTNLLKKAVNALNDDIIIKDDDVDHKEELRREIKEDIKILSKKISTI